MTFCCDDNSFFRVDANIDQMQCHGMEWNVFYTIAKLFLLLSSHFFSRRWLFFSLWKRIYELKCHVHIACFRKSGTSSMNFPNWKFIIQWTQCTNGVVWQGYCTPQSWIDWDRWNEFSEPLKTLLIYFFLGNKQTNQQYMQKKTFVPFHLNWIKL